jgi:lysophospholipase L1-like esterase
MWILILAALLLLLLIAVAVWRGGRARSILVNLMLLFASLAVMVGLVEVTLRVFFTYQFHPLVPSGERGLFWEYDPDLGWRHRPGMTGRFQKPGIFDTKVTINSRGFRGREYADNPAPGVRRVVVLGDSIVWGYGVEDNQTFTHLLERQGRNLEVINLAVSGYGTDQESLLLEKEGLRYRPDIVLMEVCENDFSEIVRDQVYYIYPKPRFVLRKQGLRLRNVPVPKATPFDRLLFWLDRRSYFWRFLNTSGPSRAGLAWMKGVARRARLSRAVPPLIRAPDADERLIVALLRRTRQTAERGGARLALFIVAPMREDHRRLILRFGEEEGIPVLDLHPVFLAAARRPGAPHIFLPRDLHWTAAGHEIVARSMGEWLAGSGLIGGADPASGTPEATVSSRSGP